MNNIQLNKAAERLENILKERRPLTGIVRIEQMIRMIKNPTGDLLEFVLEKISAAIKSDLWWLTPNEQTDLADEISELVNNGISNKHMKQTALN